MISKNVVLMEELPYQKLEKIGLSKADILALPRPVLDPLLSGCVTPILMATIEKTNGDRVEVPLKLQVTRDKNNQLNIVAYPIRKEILNDLNLSRNDVERLQNGQVIRKEMNENNVRTYRFFQLDRETQSVMHKDANSLRLGDRIKEIEKLGNIELGLNQKKAIHEGKPIELQVGDKAVTVGVDLKQTNGFRHLQGDMQAWQRSKEMEYDLANPGVMGYVKTSHNRWEYQQVVLNLQSNVDSKQTINRKIGQ